MESESILDSIRMKISQFHQFKYDIVLGIDSYFNDAIQINSSIIILSSSNINRANFYTAENEKLENDQKSFIDHVNRLNTIPEIKEYLNSVIIIDYPELYQNLIDTVDQILSEGGTISKNWRRNRKSVKHKKRSGRGSMMRKNTTKRRTSRQKCKRKEKLLHG